MSARTRSNAYACGYPHKQKRLCCSYDKLLRLYTYRNYVVVKEAMLDAATIWANLTKPMSAAPLRIVTVLICLGSLKYLVDVFSWGEFYTLHPENALYQGHIVTKLIVTALACSVMPCLVALERICALLGKDRRKPIAAIDFLMLFLAAVVVAPLWHVYAVMSSLHVVDVIK